MSNERKAVTRADARDRPAYPIAEAARYLKVAPATLRSWIVGRSYPTSRGQRHFPPLIRTASREPRVLSFWNLVEAHVLRALRTDHGVSVEAVRRALRFAEKELGIQRLLLRRELCSSGGELLLECYGELVNLSASGQLAMKRILEAHLERVDWDEMLPARLYPFLTARPNTERPVAIDPLIAFGRPVVLRLGVSTAAIVERIDVGESVEDVAEDYDLEPEEVEAAVVYERAA